MSFSVLRAEKLPLTGLQSFFENHCYDCHDDDVSKGDLDLTSLSNDLTDERTYERWVRVFDRVIEGEMPPEKKPRPELAEIDEFKEHIKQHLIKSHAKEKGTVLRRLNRREYSNTLNDLFGTNIDFEKILPEDGRSHEFNTVGETLALSTVQMKLYMEAANILLDAVIEKRTKKTKPQLKKLTYAQSKEGKTHIGKTWGKASDGSVLFYDKKAWPRRLLGSWTAKERGRYRVKVNAYAHQSEDPIVFSVSSYAHQPGSPNPIFGFYSAEPDKTKTFELECFLEKEHMIEIDPWGIFDKKNYYKRKKSFKGYKGPALAIKSVEIYGPIIDEWPSRGHKLILGGLDRKVVGKEVHWKPNVFNIQSADLETQIVPRIQELATRLFRREASRKDIDPYVDLYQQQIEIGSSIENAIRTSVVAMLCSPDFLFLIEKPGKLNDIALASRLSYFLTRTSPDRELLKVAESGNLTGNSKAYLAQAKRLFSSEKSSRFFHDFADSWLDLREIDFTAPDGNLFPEYDRYLQYSILEETRQYLKELYRSNLPISQLVKSDFTMLNKRLAEHYDLPVIHSPTVVKTKLPQDSVRGGFLSQASIHKVTANGTNTSPVLRGVWILERILGKKLQPPPPGTPGVEPDIRGAETLRETLAKHTSMKSCNSCHKNIDPPGFALEQFNPIGGFREKYRLLEGKGKENRIKGHNNDRYYEYWLGLPVDASGSVPNKFEFSDFRGFRDNISKDNETLARTLVTKMLTFGTGREMGFSDRAEIDQIIEKSASKGYRVKDLMRYCLTSNIFLTK